MKNKWKIADKIKLDGMIIELSAPILLARSRRYGWFPSLTVLSNGDIIAMVSPVADRHFSATVGMVYRSVDGGLTWNEPLVLVDGGWDSVQLTNGDTIMLPYYLIPRGDSIGRACNVFRKDAVFPEYLEKGVWIKGWPKKPSSFAPDLNIAGFVFNGQSIIGKDNTYLTTLYGKFEGVDRLSLVLAESKDGFEWKIRNIIADGSVDLKGGDGPSESAICRLKDGRIMCIFRMGGFVPYGVSFSADDGFSWTRPISMADDMLSVEPSLATIPDGPIVLSGGRPGIWLWINKEGNGVKWSKIDMVSHHNKCLPEEPIVFSANFAKQMSSCYTEIVYLGDGIFLLVYDRIPHGWAPIPPDSKDTNSVWVVQIKIKY